MLDKKIGILGGGQLGKMLCQDASKLGIRLHLLEKDDSFPSASVCPDFTFGDFKNYDDVYQFGKYMDIISVEIEAVNTEALHKLESEGKKVFPQPYILDIITDKGVQKKYYADHDFPTSKYEAFKNIETVKKAVHKGSWSFPFVYKVCKDGYDGQGVAVIRSQSDLNQLSDAPCILEELIDIDREISVIVARNENGEVKAYPVVEMEFHPSANLVEYLFSPSSLTVAQQEKASNLSILLANKLGIVGLLAVELFLTKDGTILINEVAPRPHNSGHHTIEGNITSQYEQHIRAISGLPLGDPSSKGAAVMVNLLGGEDSVGPARYIGIKECLPVSGAHFHIYGKSISKPFRKMGHVTIVADTLDEAKKKAKFIKETLIIKGDE